VSGGPRGRWRRHRDEAGYAAVLVALLASTVFLGMAALGVDTARWALEAERVQRAADAAALAGVTYMPNQFENAAATARAVAKTNGYDNAAADVMVKAEIGGQPSELKVTVSSRIKNTFGSMIGTTSAWITRTSVADYTAPAPMGSPCNAFGNEPPSQPSPAAQPAGSVIPSSSEANVATCSSDPAFWAAIEGPSTDKVQGDRFQTIACDGNASPAGTTFGCSGGKNTEYRREGYFWTVHVEAGALNIPINVQVYDPAFIYTQIDCSELKQASDLSNYMNDYASTDGKSRYVKGSGGAKYCSGDYWPGGSGTAPTTSFSVLQANATHDPRIATPFPNCTKQFAGLTSAPSTTELTQYTDAEKTKKNSNYNLQKAQIFHQWYDLCTFTPTVAGDYFIQVRTNVTTSAGTPVANKNPNGNTKDTLIWTDNANVTKEDGSGETTSGKGLNSFALRAVPKRTSDSAKSAFIAVSGNEAMPILQNKDGSTATFNLIRAEPNARNQYIAFDFYDGGDGGSSSNPATVKVIAPKDATGSIKNSSSIPNCQHAKNSASYVSAPNCQVTMSNATHNGQVEHIVIPLPADYGCKGTSLRGCWFSVQITFPGDVTDFTTWTASIGGDPVRLVE
jgi:Flp pilus assembly protein TadG